MPSPPRRLPALLAACLAAAWVGPPAAAQEVSWEEQVRPLLDRFADGVGPNRLERAVEVLLRRLQAEPTDALARLELARLELARGNFGAALTAADAAISALQAVRTVREKEREERVARRKPEDPEVPALDDLEREPRLAACAVACLAAHYQLQAQLLALKSEEQKKAYFAEHPEALAQVETRQASLRDAAGDLESAGVALRAERRRRQLLLDLPRLGEPPSPLGQSDLQGQPLHLHELRGKVVLVLFWSSELPESAQAALEVDAVRRELAPRGFAVIGVSLDTKPEAQAAFVKEHGLDWRHACTGEGFRSPDARAWSVRTVPAGVLIDHKGRVRYVDPFGPDLRLAVTDLLDRRDESSGRR